MSWEQRRGSQGKVSATVGKMLWCGGKKACGHGNLEGRWGEVADWFSWSPEGGRRARG